MQSRPQNNPPAAKPAESEKAEPKLTRQDVEAILRLQRSVTLGEIEWLLAHGNDVRVQLTSSEEFHLRNLATRLLADQHVREVRGLRSNEEFFTRVLGLYSTPFGDLAREEVQRLEAIRMKATVAIQNCDDHQRERCRCWSEAREQLYNIRRDFGEKSALGIAALAVWNSLEALARCPRPEQQPTVEAPRAGYVGFASAGYNWRAYRCDPRYATPTESL